MYFFQFFLGNNMKIKLTDESKLAAALDTVNCKADAHTAGLAQVMGLLPDINKKMASLLQIKNWQGARVTFQSGGSVPNAYKYSRIVTTVTLERGSRHWFVVGLRRSSIWGDSMPLSVSLTPAQRDAAVARFSLRFTVQEA